MPWPWTRWTWRRLVSSANLDEEEEAPPYSLSPEAGVDIESIVPHGYRLDESELDNALSPDEEEEEKQVTLVDQQHQFDTFVGSPNPGRRWGRQYSPLQDVEEGRGHSFMSADYNEMTPVRPHRMNELRINISSSNGDNRSQDDLSEMSTISSSEEVQDNLESMERSPRIQAECLRLCRALGVKQRGYDCVVLIFGCLLVFDFFLQLQRKLTEIGCGLESKDPPEHFIQWATVFTPLWIVTLFFLCRRLFELISIEFGTGNNDTLMVSGGLTAYFCVAWGCAFCLVCLVWLRLEGVLDSMPVSLTMTPCWVLACFGSILLYFATPPLAIENMGVDRVFAFEAELNVATRLNIWIFGFQCACIALKLDSSIPISWSRVMLPTVLLLITAGVIIVPCMMGIFMTFMSLAHQAGMSRSLGFSFMTSFTPLLVGGIVVYFGLSGLSAVAKSLSGDEASVPTRYRMAADALYPFLELSASLAVLLPLFKMTEDDSGLLELMTNQDGFMRGVDEDQLSEGHTVPSPKFQPISSPMVLLRHGGEYFQQASRSIRHKLLYSPLNIGSSHSLEQKECYVCIANDADSVVLPCGHGGLCMLCAKSIVKGPTEHRHCPICRSGIERVVNVGNKAIRLDSEDFVRCEEGVDVVTVQQSPDSVS